MHQCSLRLFVVVICVLMSGCAALTNPVANGIPVRLLPDELLADSYEDMEDIPLTLLRRKPIESYRLATGDVLGVYIEGVLGETDELPPVNFPDVANVEPSIGFPIPIRESGTVPLPLVDPVDVDGLTIEEAEDAIVKAYTVDKEIIKADEARIIVTLIRPRRATVLVVRQDSPANQSGQNFNIFSRAAPLAPGRQQGTGIALELPATEADVLNVLARTGGLPGPSSAQEVVILRGFADSDGEQQFRTDENGNYDLSIADWCKTNELDEDGRPRKLKIPLRWMCNEPVPFGPQDIL
ncbi:MAG: polysaccharide biosynthesis/export family protein, partial [Planctomycetota bacterium]